MQNLERFMIINRKQNKVDDVKESKWETNEKL